MRARLTVTILSVFLTTTISFSQDTSSQKTIFNILGNTKEATDVLLFLYDLDVLNYFGLNDQYDTELKKEMFKKSEEYQGKLSELQNLKTEMLNSTYYVTLPELRMTDYDLSRKGFDIRIGGNHGWADPVPPRSLPLSDNNFVCFKSLPIKESEAKSAIHGDVSSLYGGKQLYNHLLFIPVDENNGLKIEENKDDILVYFLFVPNGIETLSYKYLHLGWSKWMDGNDKALKSDKVRLILANKSSGEIYFDKSYTGKPTTTTSSSTYKTNSEPSSGTKHHVVEAGQTLYRISVMYGVSVDELKLWNGLASNEISVGQKLAIKK